MTDERLKIWIDLGKWAVVSVGLVVMTKIIDTGFKDREVGLNEIKEYDKYVLLVTDNAKISERRLLAQYFAHVTPSEKLREGWTSYFEVVNVEFKMLLQEREKKQKELLEVKRFSADTINIVSIEKIEQLEDEIKNIDNELTPAFNKPIQIKDYKAALHWEKLGFQSLINKDLEQAIIAFGKSESSYNSFHQVYEINLYLKSRKKSGDVQNDNFWQEIYRKMLNDYSWKMPPDAKTKLEESVR